MNLPDLADVTRAQVERAIRRRLWLRFSLGQDAVDVVMGVVGPVIDAQAREIKRLREAQDADVEGSAT